MNTQCWCGSCTLVGSRAELRGHHHRRAQGLLALWVGGVKHASKRVHMYMYMYVSLSQI